MKRSGIYIVLILYFIAGVVTIVAFNGTGDSGDSIHHYLYAKYSFQHPVLLLDHWAKPLFVLLSSPFAQFGFAGMKVFNLLVSLFTVYFTYKTSEALGMRNSIVSAFMVIAAPLNFILTFSGLTEPLFALAVISALYFQLKQKPILAALILSFTPFIRSEGLILMGVFGLFYLLRKDWKPLLFLATGHLTYSIAGFFTYHDLLWVFNKIPYASLKSPYGEGNWSHFIYQQYYVIGLPLTFFFWIGFLANIADLRKGVKIIMKEEMFLVFFGFLSFLLFHTLAWKFGMFNSMGLKRVLIGMMPFIALIALKGFNLVTENNFLKGKPKLGIQALAVICILAFPVIPNPASINWKKDMTLSADQMVAQDVGGFLGKTRVVHTKYFYSHPYLSEILDIDHFDPEIRMELNSQNLKSLKRGDFLIWENWFAVVEDGITEEFLEKNYKLNKVKEFRSADPGSSSTFIVYRAE